MRKYRFPLILLFALPLLLRLEYLWRAWRYSPLDRPCALFAVLALAIGAGLIWRHRRDGDGSPDVAALWILAFPLAMIVTGVWRSLNLIYLTGAVLLLPSAVWFLWGWRWGWRLFPAFGILLLSLPTTALLSLRAESEFWLVLKIAAAFLLAACAALSEHFRYCPGRSGGLFRVALVFYLVLLAASRPDFRTGDPFAPDIPSRIGDFLGSRVEPDSFDRRFFSGCRAMARYRFFDRDNATVGVLELVSGRRINDIHAPATCLLSAGWRVTRQTPFELVLPEGRLCGERLDVERRGLRRVFYMWFSGEAFSTGSFVRFRRNWRRNAAWKIYQLATDADAGTDAAAERLERFLKALGNASVASGSPGKR